MKTLFSMILLLLSMTGLYAQPGYNISGKVTSASGDQPLVGATVSVPGLQKAVITNTEGKFYINLPTGKSRLMVSYIGFDTAMVDIDPTKNSMFSITLHEKRSELQEVVVSTGYQNLPRERATGSFNRVDSTLIQRGVSTDVLSRIEDNVPGLSFNRSASAGGANNPISIRGRSTLFANANPLIVVDNFPFEGDLAAINPNDVESITVLKDAAAASIWGARAGNGVIVITTRRGKFNQAPVVSLLSSVTVGNKPELYRQPRMSTADYIETERALFAKGYYSSDERSLNRTALSPVIESLIAAREGRITTAQAESQINALKNNDVRSDYDKHLYRKSVNQQYSIQVTGGAEDHNYHFSTGYDRNQSSLVRNDLSRVAISAGNNITFLKKRLVLSADLLYTRQQSSNNNPGTYFWNGGLPLYPYAKLADDQGVPLNVTKDLRQSFATASANAGLLDWQYSPLTELALADNTVATQNLRMTAGLSYRILPGLQVQTKYLYENNRGNGVNAENAASYNVRDQINRFSNIGQDGTINRAIPLGGIYTQDLSFANTHYFRAQVNYNRQIGSRNKVTLLGGYEIRHIGTDGRTFRYYGYDAEHGTSLPVDYVSTFTSFVNPFSTSNRIVNVDRSTLLTDNFISWFANGSWTLDGKYMLSGSARFDRSNLVGVNTNQKGVPLWSVGGAWDVAKETFYKSDWLPVFKIRATYGISGNIERSLSAYTTAMYYSGTYQLTGYPFATVVNPPNPDLRWETTRMVNLGIDFATAGSRISGTVEYYHKNGNDLIGDAPYPASSGVTTFRGNTAQTKGSGIDINVTGKIFARKNSSWSSTLLISHSVDRVTRYLIAPTVNAYVAGGAPVEGRPLFAIYSYAWEGLDPATGDPQGMLDGKTSKDYSKILGSTPADQVIYNGSARPTWFGAWRNNFNWRTLTLSATISYRFGYYFRRNSIIYGNNIGLVNANGDFANRWQKPGDERVTDVPSVPQNSNNSRDLFYTYSAVLVEKGDHIRFQDLRLAWQPNVPAIQKWSKNAQLFVYANNIGMLWKATRVAIDPDFGYQAPPLTISAGISLTIK